ncbi:hypothetical protein LOTGIDRAFT_161525 [Lottia gigantea]|uniref:Methyltransferase domain-containing protein n=1 Tax=Lottia gigantea TaxID=225164 RepID=V4AGL0_LOTGI|nr:hypothetical protein LOTGIDRAFT_161525 [Lottia gigantea]ESO94300.1 hypothetical protein LOTGIDRAFT_161525 [Lottia gigantea]
MDTLSHNNAYDHNSQAFSADITITERMDYYSKWCRSGDYEKDLSKGGTYNGPIIAGEAISRLYPDDKNIRILDIAAGTGYVGEELRNKGYHNVDALEPSEGMLQQAIDKNIYKTHICDILGGTSVHINDDEYDCTIVCGGMGEGHIPCSGLNEMIRVVKPGGVVCIVMREEYLFTVSEYKDRLEPLMKQLEDDEKWEISDRIIFPNHFAGKSGVLFVFRVKCDGV